ncbi:hypothetical protein C5167_040696 [Papaver somniferum]|uniref:Uncharacterized protein n=1 Tax=Papaver somniferum TaxID=3469 RepID=A0A4Y7IJU5_PAPSO|nr:hypothetical protein C5167_040696 [Papaver somniferum]
MPETPELGIRKHGVLACGELEFEAVEIRFAIFVS